MYRNYYSMNDMPQKIDKKNDSVPQQYTHNNNEHEKCDEKTHKDVEKSKGFLGNLELDDIILLGVIIILLADDCDDKLLLVAIAAIFVSGII